MRLPVVRVNLRTAVRDRLLDGLLRGDPAPGQSLNEAQLAAELGVSRTPLREALVGLAHEGFLHAEPGRGFFAAPLTLDEVEELYPILWTLEGLALRGAGAFLPQRIDVLEKLNRTLSAARRDPIRALSLDHEWHASLLSSCPNRRLLESIETLKAQTFRYEYAYFRDAGLIESSTDHHDAILASLRAGHIGGAMKGLENNWRLSLDFLLPWLETRAESP